MFTLFSQTNPTTTKTIVQPSPSQETASSEPKEPALLGKGHFSLFGIKFNLFGSRPKTGLTIAHSFSSKQVTSANPEPPKSLAQKIKAYFFGAPTVKLDQMISVLDEQSHQMISVPAKGTWNFTPNKEGSQPQLAFINNRISIENFRDSNKDPNGTPDPDYETFINDIKRSTSLTFEEHSTKGLPEEKGEKALEILSTLSTKFFPCSSPQAKKLAKDLQLLNPQGLIASIPSLFCSEDAPNNQFVSAGGFSGTYTYTILNNSSEKREIQIILKGDIAPSSGGVIFGKLGEENLSIPLEDYTSTSYFEMKLKAQINADGRITSLICESLNGDYCINKK